MCARRQVGELQFQLHRCQQLLAGCPYLDLSPSEQKALLDSKRQLLQEKRSEFIQYTVHLTDLIVMEHQCVVMVTGSCC